MLFGTTSWLFGNGFTEGAIAGLGVYLFCVWRSIKQQNIKQRREEWKKK